MSALLNTPPPLNIVFAGTPEFAAIHLDALINSRHKVVGVYSQPDRPSGRGKKLTASPVKQAALNAGIPVYQPISLKDADAQNEFAEVFKSADILIVVAYGLILPVFVLNTPRLGCINVHASLLPRWRGAAPIQRAIEAGDIHTGITIMQMDEGLDTGNMLSKTACDITPFDTAQTLHDKLAAMGPKALLETLADIVYEELTPEPQNDALATYASKLLKPEAAINWQQDSAQILRRIRAFNPFPVCNSQLTLKSGEGASVLVKIFQAQAVEITGNHSVGDIVQFDKNVLVVACGDAGISIEQLQLPGKKPVDIASFHGGFGQKIQAGFFS